DWSTGLLYKGGRYFDPALGIWLVLLPLMVVQAWPGRRRKQLDKNTTLLWFVRLVLVAICALSLLTACNNEKETLERACIDVKMPTLTSIEIISVQDIQLFPVPNGGGDWRVQFGNRVDSASDPNMLPGIVIQAKLDAQTEVNGTLEWVQDVVTKRIQERTDAFVKLTDSPQRFAYGDGKRALDTWDPYKAADDLIIDSAGVFSSKIWDSPGLPLPLLPPLKYVMIEDSFRSFVMWRPTGLNCRLPLGMIEWEWRVEIENTETEEVVPQVANWIIISQSIPKVGTLGGKTDQLPTLSPNVTEFEWYSVP
ncbi:MAG: hypothetical protein WHX52_23175, partial [Anaerolineae bacterium]